MRHLDKKSSLLAALTIPPCPVPIPEVIVEGGNENGYGKRNVKSLFGGMDVTKEDRLIEIQNRYVDERAGKAHHPESDETNAG